MSPASGSALILHTGANGPISWRTADVASNVFDPVAGTVPTSITERPANRTPTGWPGAPFTVSPQPPTNMGAGAAARAAVGGETLEGAAKADNAPPKVLAAHSNVAAPATVVTLARAPIGASVSLTCLSVPGCDVRVTIIESLRNDNQHFQQIVVTLCTHCALYGCVDRSQTPLLGNRDRRRDPAQRPRSDDGDYAEQRRFATRSAGSWSGAPSRTPPWGSSSPAIRTGSLPGRQMFRSTRTTSMSTAASRISTAPRNG